VDHANIRIGLLPRDRRSEALEIDAWAFPQNDPDFDVDLIFDSLDWDRFFGAWVDTARGERLAGINTSYRFEMTLPSFGVSPKTVPSAGLTWVGVHPQFRRRGVLTAMMLHQLRAVRDEGLEPVAALFASEPVIYGRFGYGLAARHLALRVPTGSTLRPFIGEAASGPASSDVEVRFELADVDAHVDLVAEVYDRARLLRPGSVSRPSRGLNRYSLVDPPSSRVEAERLRIAIASDAAGDPTGYAIFRRSLAWAEVGPAGTVDVRELVAADGATERELWLRMLNLDLVATMKAHRVAIDGVLATALERLPSPDSRLWDDVWIRVLDVPGALSARGYGRPINTVLEVRDTMFPENSGRWRLEAGEDGATCAASSDEPDISLDVRELGSAYLGGTTFTTLAAAGLVTVHRPERLAGIASAFQSPVQPMSIWSF
jgi:predicted acetyltransferase